jgi:hypothetical protein
MFLLKIKGRALAAGLVVKGRRFRHLNYEWSEGAMTEPCGRYQSGKYPTTNMAPITYGVSIATVSTTWQSI